jgi:hypothetical protein
MTAAPLLHFGDRKLCDVEKPRNVDGEDSCVVGLCVFSEGFGNKDPCVVDQRVDTPKLRQTLRDCTLRRITVSDITGDYQDVRITRWLH